MRVTLYSKPNCPLCSELKADLLALQSEIHFTLHERNIEDDAVDFARFRYLIPVLDLADGELLYPPHNLPRLLHTLRAAQAAASK